MGVGLGRAVGVAVGGAVGTEVGADVGADDGGALGNPVGYLSARADGFRVPSPTQYPSRGAATRQRNNPRGEAYPVGVSLGADVGTVEGSGLGGADGTDVGACVIVGECVEQSFM